MRNVKMTTKGNILHIEVDLSQPGVVSTSGKSMVLASTEGNVHAPGTEDVQVGLNVYRPKTDAPAK